MVFTIDMPFYMGYIYYMTNTNRIQNIELTNPRQREQTRVTTPAGFHVLVSTVLLPMLFGRVEYETMAFAADETGKVTDWTELGCNRYDTEQEALEGHADVVAKWYNEPMLQLPSSTEEN